MLVGLCNALPTCIIAPWGHVHVKGSTCISWAVTGLSKTLTFGSLPWQPHQLVPSQWKESDGRKHGSGSSNMRQRHKAGRGHNTGMTAWVLSLSSPVNYRMCWTTYIILNTLLLLVLTCSARVVLTKKCIGKCPHIVKQKEDISLHYDRMG